jgi:hypothetical protein
LVSCVASFDENETIGLKKIEAPALKFRDEQVTTWAWHRSLIVVTHNPITSGTFRWSHRFKEPLMFNWGDVEVIFKSIDITTSISGSWYSQRVPIDSRAAIYDWIRQTIHPAPGDNHLDFNFNFDEDAGEKLQLPPTHNILQTRAGKSGINMELLFTEGFGIPSASSALDKYIIEEDLDPFIPNLDADRILMFNMTSQAEA